MSSSRASYSGFSDLMERMPHVLEHHMLPYMKDPNDVKNFSTTSKAARHVAGPRLKTDRDVVISLVEAWSRENATAMTANQTSACSAAAEQGETEVLKWLHNYKGLAWKYRDCCMAAAGSGHIMTLIWLRECGMDDPSWNRIWVSANDTGICAAAKDGDHEAVFEWARGVGCAWLGAYDPELNTVLRQGDIVSYYSEWSPDAREALVLGVNVRQHRLFLYFPNNGGGGSYPMLDGDTRQSQVRYQRETGYPVTLDVLREFEFNARRVEHQEILNRPLSQRENQQILNGIHHNLFRPMLRMLADKESMKDWTGVVK